MNQTLYFATQFSKSFAILAMALVAFTVGNCGLGGTTLVTFATFVVSVSWYGIYCSLLGPPQQRERSPWIQGFAMIISTEYGHSQAFCCMYGSHTGVWTTVRPSRKAGGFGNSIFHILSQPLFLPVSPWLGLSPDARWIQMNKIHPYVWGVPFGIVTTGRWIKKCFSQSG